MLQMEYWPGSKLMKNQKGAINKTELADNNTMIRTAESTLNGPISDANRHLKSAHPSDGDASAFTNSGVSCSA